MNEPSTAVVVTESQAEASLRTLGHVSYALHAVVAVAAVVPGAQASVLLLVAAFILDLVKQGEAAGTWQASHFRWRIRSVVISFVAYVLTSPLFLLLWLPGMLAWAIVSIWFLYRVVRGWLALNDRRALPV